MPAAAEIGEAVAISPGGIESVLNHLVSIRA
jgi:hypothetical protein